MLWWFTETTLVAGVLALAAGMTARFRWFGIGPAARHALWLAVMLKLLTPPLVSAPWAVRLEAPRRDKVEPAAVAVESVRVALIESDAGGPAVPEARDPLGSDSTPGGLDAGLGLPTVAELLVVDGRASAPIREQVVEQRVPAAAPVWWSRLDPGAVGRWLLWAWVVSTAVVTLIQTVRIVRFARRLRSGGPAPAWIVEETERLGERMGVRVPRALVVPGLGVPMLWCLGRPVLLLPEHLVGSLDATRWRGVLAHELAHLRRGDPWFGRIALVAGLAWWWNPLYWLVRRRLDAEAELACDAWVVWALPDDRLTYARTMLEICESLCRTVAPPLAPALGGNESGRFFERRLTMILNDRVPCRLSWPGLIAPGLLVLIGLPSWTVASAVADDGPKTLDESKIILIKPAEKDGKTITVIGKDGKTGESQTVTVVGAARVDGKPTEGKPNPAQTIEVRVVGGSPDDEATLREKARAAREKARAHIEAIRSNAQARKEAARAAVEKAEATLAEIEKKKEAIDRATRNETDPSRVRAQKQLEEARAQLEQARRQLEAAEKAAEATAKAQVRVEVLREVRSDDGKKPEAEAEAGADGRGRREVRRRFEIRRGTPSPDREDKDSDAAKDRDEDDDDDDDDDIEIEIRDFSKVFGPDSELMKHLRSLGPAIEKKLREKIGPGTELDEKLKGLSGRLDKELKDHLGLGSDFDKAMKDYSKALEERFGPGSDFDKHVKEFYGKLEERPRERGERDREREGEVKERERERPRERPRAESRPREESPRPDARAMEEFEQHAERARAAAREARRRGLEAQIRTLREQLERLEKEQKADEGSPRRP